MKSFFAPVFEPLGAIWFLMVLSLLWLLWRRQWRSAIALGIPTLLIFLIGSTPCVNSLVAKAERPYADVKMGTIAPADVVVALGGGESFSNHDPLTFSIGEAGDRYLVAAELARLGKAKTLVLGGSWAIPGQPDVPVIARVQDWLTSWKLFDAGVTNLGICPNTHAEAIAFKPLRDTNGWQRIILVTSALHIPRSVAVFKKQGINVIPFPCDFQAYGVPGSRVSPFPRQYRFNILANYLHEQIGWWVYRWKGWI